jgi:hypothetical protein
MYTRQQYCRIVFYIIFSEKASCYFSHLYQQWIPWRLFYDISVYISTRHKYSIFRIVFYIFSSYQQWIPRRLFWIYLYTVLIHKASLRAFPLNAVRLDSIQNNPTIKEKMPIPQKVPHELSVYGSVCVCVTADGSWRAGVGMEM